MFLCLSKIYKDLYQLFSVVTNGICPKLIYRLCRIIIKYWSKEVRKGFYIFDILDQVLRCKSMDTSVFDEFHYLSHIMRRSVYAICKQQKRRSACASAQSDQRLCFRCLDSIIPLNSIHEISSFYLASVAEQADLSLTWSKPRKTGFLMTRLLCQSVYWL